MILTLYRFHPELTEAVEYASPLRSVVVREEYKTKDVMVGIQSVIGNHAGKLCLELKTTAQGKPLRIGLIVDTREEGFSVRAFADATADAVVGALKNKAMEILERR